jgi:hypothetical protein
MPIKRVPEQSNNEKLTLEFNNGDMAALERAVIDWGFKDEASALRFGIAVLLKAESRDIQVGGNDGEKVSISPSASLLKDDSDGGS